MDAFPSSTSARVVSTASSPSRPSSFVTLAAPLSGPMGSACMDVGGEGADRDESQGMGAHGEGKM